MKLKLLAAVIVLGSAPASAPAFAQSDVLCSTLATIIAASAETPAPFASLGVEFVDPLGATTIDDLPNGLGAESCGARMPASAKRHGVAEGEYWEFHCTLYSSSTSGNADADYEAEAYRDNVAKRVRTCVAKKGWADAQPPAPRGDLRLVKGGVEVSVVSKIEGDGRGPKIYSALFAVRLRGGPKPPKLESETGELRPRQTSRD